MHMKDWEEKLNAFLRFTGREILENAGAISKEIADLKAKEQYMKYEEHRRNSEKEKAFEELAK